MEQGERWGKGFKEVLRDLEVGVQKGKWEGEGALLFFWFLFESTTCLSHHSFHVHFYAKRSLRNEHVSCSAVPISICCSYILPMFRMSLPSIKTGLHPCSALPTREDPPEFLSSSPSCAPPATRVPPGGFAPAGAPPAPPPEAWYLYNRCDWGVKGRGTGTVSDGVTKQAALYEKCSPGPSGRSGACERAWRKRAREAWGRRRRRDGWGEGWMRGRLERILLKELLGEWAKRAEERGREGTLHQKKLTRWNKFNCNKI